MVSRGSSKKVARRSPAKKAVKKRAAKATPSRAERLQSDYDLVANLATTAEAGGLAKERSVLLLWFLRNVVGVDDLDAYQYVCDGDHDNGVDGIYLESSTGDEDYETLVIYQSKYTQAPTEVGPNSLTRLISSAAQFSSAAGLKALLGGKVEPKLRELIKQLDLEKKITDAAIAERRLRIRLSLVTTGLLNGEAKRLVEATNKDRGAGYLSVYDLGRLAPLARAVATPEVTIASIDVPSAKAERLVLPLDGTRRIAVVPVRATDIVTWDGIEDRRLFELNVRREVRRNGVRDKLDHAIQRRHEHGDFLAFHNGMTVVCDSFEEKSGKLVVKKPSIVNGAQSAIAFTRGDDDGALTEDLRVFVKFIEVKGRPHLAKDISWRSNNQSAVNQRNLVALGGPQARLVAEFATDYPDITYETRPDASLTPKTSVIQNDDAAQLLCAVYNALPWLAVKRLVLFESDNHAMIFNQEISASHVVLVDYLAKQIDAQKDRVPDDYRKSWRLTRLALVYLLAQIMLSTPELKAILDDPKKALKSRVKLDKAVKQPVRIAIATLKQRHDQRDRDQEADEFNTDFKRQDVLHDLRNRARDNYALVDTLE